jgi:anaerobic magnesium-protoporphyrin IX monomethyl ester cyclase
VSKQLGAKTHWQASGDLAMMFHGTYTSPFYREVRDLLHDEVRISSQHAEPCGDVGDGERRSLQRRWDHLLARQESFLNTPPREIAAVGAPAAGLP